MIVAKRIDTREWVDVNPYGVMSIEVRPLDGEPHIYLELGNGETHVTKLCWQRSPWLRRFLAVKAGIEDD